MTEASDFYLTIQNRGTPFIAIDRSLDDEHFGCVISEDFGAGFELTQSRIDASTQSIGLVGALLDLDISRERQLGFKSTAKEAGIECHVAYGEHFNNDEGKRVFNGWVKLNTIPDAIVTTSYTLLEGVLDVLIEQPESMGKVKLATFGDNRLLDFLPTKVNSLPQQFELICSKRLGACLKCLCETVLARCRTHSKKIKDQIGFLSELARPPTTG